MREIKFRAWNIINNIMLFKVIGISNCDYPIFIDDKLITNHKGQYRLMQYTGLKDKNGIEIYENDIIQIKDNSVMNNEFAEVIFFKGSFRVNWISYRDSLCYELNNYSRRCEVKGNIYENKELLK